MVEGVLCIELGRQFGSLQSFRDFGGQQWCFRGWILYAIERGGKAVEVMLGLRLRARGQQ